MRAGIVACGAILMVLGFVSFFMGFSVCNEIDKYGILGQLGRIFSSDINEAYNTGRLLQLIGGSVGIVGLVLTVGGAIASPRIRRKEYRRLEAAAGFCSNCGVRIEADANFCPSCGKQVAVQIPKVCRRCGENLSADNIYCPKCGEKVS